MILSKKKLLLIYWIIINPPMNKHASAFVFGKKRFYRSNFNERSIHADIGRDINELVCNVGKQSRDNDVINFARDADNGDINYGDGNAVNDDPNVGNNDAVNYASADDNLTEKEDAECKTLLEKDSKRTNLKQDGKKADETTDNIEDSIDTFEKDDTVTKTVGKTMATREEKRTEGYEQVGSLQKREVIRGGKSNMEAEGQGNMAEQTVHHAQTAQLGLEHPKRLVSHAAPKEPFRKKNPVIMRQEAQNLNDIRADAQYQHKFPLQATPQITGQYDQSDGMALQNYQSFQEPNSALGPQGYGGDVNQAEGTAELKENPLISRLFEKQRQIENLKQLLMQVESKFQMEVNEVGRLQQSVAEAEKELDDAVRVMQDIKMRNIKGLQHIEAAQDAAGRNLESKALKAHAEESQLAMHDQMLFSERQRLNALRAQMIYLQTELAAAQNSGILTFDDGEKTGYRPYGFHYKSPSLTDSLKYFQNPSGKQNKGPYMIQEASGTSNDMGARRNQFLMVSPNVPVKES